MPHMLAEHPLIAYVANQLTLRQHEQKRVFKQPLALPAALPSTPTHDLILAPISTLHNTDLPTQLLNIGKALVGDGLLLGALWGNQSLQELRAAATAADIALAPPPLPDAQDVGDLLQRLKFALPVVDRDLLTLEYPDFPSLWADLRSLGSRTWPQLRQGLLTPRQWQRLSAQYPRQPDGSLHLQVEVLYLSAWRPHQSQQQPLQPGQFKVKFEEVL